MARFSLRWWPFHPYSDWQVKRRGRLDGLSRPAIPTWDTEDPAPFIGGYLKSAGEHDVQLLARTWGKVNGRLKARWMKAEINCRQAVLQSEKAESAFQEACSDYQAIHGERPPSGGWGRTFGYGILMLMLFIFELPLNAVVFRVFGENEVLTFIFTCGVAVVLLLSAHELGKLLREGAWGHPIKRTFIVGLLLLPLMIVGGVAYAREEYLNYLPELLRTMNPWVLYIAFAAINLTIFAVATILSYQHYQRGLDEVIRTGARLRRALRAHTLARQRLHLTRARRVATHHAYHAMFHQIQFEVRRLKGLYQTENLITRNDRGQEHATALPRSFVKDITLAMPPELDEGHLEWSMDETGYLNREAIVARGTV